MKAVMLIDRSDEKTEYIIIGEDEIEIHDGICKAEEQFVQEDCDCYRDCLEENLPDGCRIIAREDISEFWI